MALAIDASTPALASTATAVTVTTASFTPPAGALVVLLIGCNNPGAGAGDTTFTSVTNTGNAITWTRRARKAVTGTSDGGAGQEGSVDIYTGTSVSGAITVSATNAQSGTGDDKAMQAIVLTGASTAVLTNIGTASADGGLPSVNVASCLTGSHIFAVNSDWSQLGLGTFGSGQTMISEYNNSGQVTIHFWRTTAVRGSDGTQTMNQTAPSAQDYNLAAIEIRASAVAAAAGPKSLNYQAAVYRSYYW